MFVIIDKFADFLTILQDDNGEFLRFASWEEAESYLKVERDCCQEPYIAELKPVKC